MHDAIRRTDWPTVLFLLERNVPQFECLSRIPDAADFLKEHGRLEHQDPQSLLPATDSKREMSVAHPLWRCKLSIERMEEVGGHRLTRAATLKELQAIRQLKLHPMIIEYYAHFMPFQRGGPGGFFQDFVGLMLDNFDIVPHFYRCGFFSLGSTMEGDNLAFGPTSLKDDQTPPIYRFDHEMDWENATTEELSTRGEVCGKDIVHFIESLATSA